METLTAGELLHRAARRSPDAVALVDASHPARRWTWAELLRHTSATAKRLAASHQPGDIVAICAPSETDWVVLELGCLLAGLVVQPIDPGLDSAEVANALRRTGASTLAVSGDLTSRSSGWRELVNV